MDFNEEQIYAIKYSIDNYGEGCFYGKLQNFTGGRGTVFFNDLIKVYLIIPFSDIIQMRPIKQYPKSYLELLGDKK